LKRSFITPLAPPRRVPPCACLWISWAHPHQAASASSRRPPSTAPATTPARDAPGVHWLHLCGWESSRCSDERMVPSQKQNGANSAKGQQGWWLNVIHKIRQAQTLISKVPQEHYPPPTNTPDRCFPPPDGLPPPPASSDGDPDPVPPLSLAGGAGGGSVACTKDVWGGVSSARRPLGGIQAMPHPDSAGQREARPESGGAPVQRRPGGRVISP
jgi:hypothetical protein